MVQLVKSGIAPYCGFKSFEVADFQHCLSPQDRKIVLRDATVESIQAILDFVEPLQQALDSRIASHAYGATNAAVDLLFVLSPTPGPDRLFQSPKKVAMRRMGMPGSGVIPSADNALSMLSLHLVGLAKSLANVSLADVLATLRQIPKPDLRSTYEKAFGIPAE